MPQTLFDVVFFFFIYYYYSMCNLPMQNGSVCVRARVRANVCETEIKINFWISIVCELKRSQRTSLFSSSLSSFSFTVSVTLFYFVHTNFCIRSSSSLQPLSGSFPSAFKLFWVFILLVRYKLFSLIHRINTSKAHPRIVSKRVKRI